MPSSEPCRKREASAIEDSAEEGKPLESGDDHGRDDVAKMWGGLPEPPPGTAFTLKLVVLGLDGGILADLQIPIDTTPAQLKAMLGMGSQLGIPEELLQLIAPCGRILQPSDLALVDLDIKDGDHIICVRLPVPLNWDVIGLCDDCGHCRHLFYGYARQNPLADLEPVIALCPACGGAPRLPDETEDDMSHVWEVGSASLVRL